MSPEQLWVRAVFRESCGAHQEDVVRDHEEDLPGCGHGMPRHRQLWVAHWRHRVQVSTAHTVRDESKAMRHGQSAFHTHQQGSEKKAISHGM